MNEKLTICPPVAIFGFARPDSLKLVFERVRQARPAMLFLVLDYPREGRADDIGGWNACKKIFETVDWPCEVKRNYAERNMGCAERIQSGITWVFEHVDRAMILEDDCVPDLTFFRFCGELLEKYKDDTRVGMIAGCDEHFHVKSIDFHGDSYYFDRFSSIWGWATWRRVWRLNDVTMSYWPEVRKRYGLMDGVFRNRACTRLHLKYTDSYYNKTGGCWDGVWQSMFYKENLLCIHPTVNQITNYGCGRSSRTEDESKRHWWQHNRHNPWDRRPTEPITFPLQHPVTMIPHIESERWRFLDSGAIRPWYKRFGYWLKHLAAVVVYKIYKHR